MLPDLEGDGSQGVINVVPMNFRADHFLREGSTEFEERHYVDLVKKGTNGECTPWAINKLRKNVDIWRFIEPSYEAWLKGQEEPTEGTPVDVLPFLTPGIVSHLKSIMIRTAEDLANAEESTIERIGMGARSFKQKAQAYLDAKVGDGAVAALNQKLTHDNETLRGEIAALRELVEGMEKKNTNRPTRPVSKAK